MNSSDSYERGEKAMSNDVIDKYIDGGLAALERMEGASLHAESVSLETLLRVIRENEDTEYGRKYDFKNIPFA